MDSLAHAVPGRMLFQILEEPHRESVEAIALARMGC